MRVWCASPNRDDASPPVKQPRLNVNIHPRCDKHNTALRHQGRLCCTNDTHLVSISSLVPGKLISFPFQTLQTAGRRTYCENVYLSGRHRQQWLCVRIIIQDLLFPSSRDGATPLNMASWRLHPLGVGGRHYNGYSSISEADHKRRVTFSGLFIFVDKRIINE